MVLSRVEVAPQRYRHGVELLLKCSVTSSNGGGVLMVDEIGAPKDAASPAGVGKHVWGETGKLDYGALTVPSVYTRASTSKTHSKQSPTFR